MKGGQIPWNAVAICEMSKTSTPYERRFGQPIKWPIIPLVALDEYHPSSPKDHSRIHHVGKKYYLESFLSNELIAEGIRKGDLLFADLEDLEKLDTSDIYPRRIKAKGVLIRQEDDELYSRSHLVQQN